MRWQVSRDKRNLRIIPWNLKKHQYLPELIIYRTSDLTYGVQQQCSITVFTIRPFVAGIVFTIAKGTNVGYLTSEYNTDLRNMFNLTVYNNKRHSKDSCGCHNLLSQQLLLLIHRDFTTIITFIQISTNILIKKF